MLIYYFNDDKHFTYCDKIDDSNTLPENATKLAPVDENGAGLYEPITWDGAKWVGTSQSDWQKANQSDSDTDTYVSAQAKFNAQLTAQLATTLKTVATQATAVATLTKQLASQQLVNTSLTKQLATLSAKN